MVSSTVFAFYVTIIPEPSILQAPFLPGGGRKGRLGASSLSERLAPSTDYAKVSSAGTMSTLVCGGDHWIAFTERGGLMVRGDNAEGQLGIDTRNSEWYPMGLDGIRSVVGNEVGELIGGVHALALLAATQAHATALPAGVLAHPFDDKALLRLVLPALGYNDFRT